MAKRKYSADERASALEFGSYEIYKRARIEGLRGNYHSSEYEIQWLLPDWDVCRCICRASLARTVRLKKRLAPMIAHGAWFLTLTFNGSVLASTTPKVRRVYVRRFLKSIALEYVANKDFGGHGEREHYHAVIALPYDLGSLLRSRDRQGRLHNTLPGWIHGFSNWERIGRHGNDNDLRAVSKYLSKLQNHALKNTASDEIMIFSRKAKNK